MKKDTRPSLKVQIVSDLHRDFSKLKLSNLIRQPPDPKEVVLFVAGDFLNGAGFIGRKDRAFLYEELEDIACNYKRVVYVFGNHEHYGGKVVEETEAQFRSIYGGIRSLAPQNGVINFLEKDAIQIDDVYIWGATLWANFAADARPHVVGTIEDSMTDFTSHGIKDHTIETCKARYEATVKSLEAFLNSVPYDAKVIVATHFAPFLDSVHPKYFGNICNGYFANNLYLPKNLRDKIALWIHGHTHSSFDYIYKAGDGDKGMRVVCNPFGYGSENAAGYKHCLTIEV